MFRRIRRRLKMHISFNSYLKIATFLEPIEQKIDLLKYAFFTRTKEGRCLRGTAFPKVHRLISNVVFGACPYLVLLTVLLLVSAIVPQCVADVLLMYGDASAASGFMAAILAIAGIFLTLLCLAAVFSTLWLPGSDNLAKEPPMPQISAFPSIKALSILLLVPLNSTSLPWWTTLSIIAEASLSSPRIVPHLLNSMLVVNTTLRFS